VITESGNSLSFVNADGRDPLSLIPHALLWISEAGNPYYDWLFGGRDATTNVLKSWLRRSSSEVSVSRAQFLFCDSEIAGGFIALDGLQLRNARKADTASLLNLIPLQERLTLMSRLFDSKVLFPPIGDDEFYLSKMGLNAPFRGRRLGQILTERYLMEGKARGFVRYRLDVHAENEPAIRCYRHFGFKVANQSESTDGQLRYFSMVL
jgi:ribosomal protein S18 acetylase RimI-like enzyme